MNLHSTLRTAQTSEAEQDKNTSSEAGGCEALAHGRRCVGLRNMCKRSGDFLRPVLCVLCDSESLPWAFTSFVNRIYHNCYEGDSQAGR